MDSKRNPGMAGTSKGVRNGPPKCIALGLMVIAIPWPWPKDHTRREVQLCPKQTTWVKWRTYGDPITSYAGTWTHRNNAKRGTG